VNLCSVGEAREGLLKGGTVDDENMGATRVGEKKNPDDTASREGEEALIGQVGPKLKKRHLNTR